eukprot:scaffold49105_cov21-Tisochrysis_lutea.AAC.1
MAYLGVGQRPDIMMACQPFKDSKRSACKILPVVEPSSKRSILSAEALQKWPSDLWLNQCVCVQELRERVVQCQHAVLQPTPGLSVHQRQRRLSCHPGLLGVCCQKGLPSRASNQSRSLGVLEAHYFKDSKASGSHWGTQ